MVLGLTSCAPITVQVLFQSSRSRSALFSALKLPRLYRCIDRPPPPEVPVIPTSIPPYPNKPTNFSMRPKVYQFFVALFASFGSFLYGYDLGVIASVVASDSFVDKFLQTSGSTKSGTVVALFTSGGFNSFQSHRRDCTDIQRCFLWCLRCWILRPPRPERNPSSWFCSFYGGRHLADCSRSHQYALCWPAVCWLWYRNFGRDCASISGRDLSCQHQRYCHFIATGHVGHWLVGGQLDWLWMLY